MGILLILLVMVDTFLTGWLLAQHKALKQSVAAVANVQESYRKRDIRNKYEYEDEGE